ncbi:site-specific integrase [Aeromicrobium sp. Root472D3]|uniref:tyrosine-type recombinase/integrase n=1 Tax=Aeromicrobium sp. Root472D3 TaxID=1736540 RepID=UPI000B330A2F|nr:site-specific integrase [Aeromicrobium sp. Root472D3]
MATLEKREQTPGRVTFRVRWWANDRQRSKSFKDHGDAKRFKAVLEGDMVNGNYLDPKHGTITVAKFVADHAEALVIDVRVSTRNRIDGIYRSHVLPEFGHLPLNAVDARAVAAWVNKMSLSLNASTVRKNVFALRRVLDLAVSYGLIRTNVAAAVRLPAEPKHEQKYLTHSQAWTLAETIPAEFKAMVLVAVFGGLRFGEVTGLQRKHILIETNQIQVCRTLIDLGKGGVTFGPPKTKTSIRTVTVPRSIMLELVAHMDAYTAVGDDALVFTGKRGTAIRRSWFYRMYWLPTVEKAGLSGLRFHDLRHTFVALWVSLGRNAKQVSKAAGHSSVSFTLDRYGHLYESDDAGLADELDAMLSANRTNPANVA